jgi:hypothetical protein
VDCTVHKIEKVKKVKSRTEKKVIYERNVVILSVVLIDGSILDSVISSRIKAVFPRAKRLKKEYYCA